MSFMSGLFTMTGAKRLAIELKNLIEQRNVMDIKLVYPVGSIFLTTVDTNPADLFGFGLWEQIKDTFLLAAGSTYAAGTTGGEATVTLQKTQVPSVTGTIAMHSQGVATNIHDVTGCFSSGLTNSDAYRAGGTEASGAVSIGRINFNNGGSGAAHNNMPPYMAVYVWKRTA